jgi:3-methylfumaryl-CoA hydratase
MTALLDADPAAVTEDFALPPLWHWLFFHDPVPQSRLGADGHPRTGTFLPPVGNRRRMWAGGRLRFHRQVQAGHAVSRSSTIDRIESKRGHSGELLFVCLKHAIANGSGLAIEEEQDLVYRSPPASGDVARRASPAAVDTHDPEFFRLLRTDPVQLFRYSALTFNGHRIHYDQDYATGAEGYSGLVVHGPLLATLLVRLLLHQWPERELETFEFRALHPVFCGGDFSLRGRRIDDTQVSLWICDANENLCMQALAGLRIQAGAG